MIECVSTHSILKSKTFVLNMPKQVIRKAYSLVCNIIKQKGKNKMGIKGKNDRMVVLACEDCKERNYTTVKNKKNIKDRLELSKYCPTCRKHTSHKETK